MPAPHHSVFYRLDALPAAQPTSSKHRNGWCILSVTITAALVMAFWQYINMCICLFSFIFEFKTVAVICV